MKLAHAAGVAASGMTRLRFASGIEVEALTALHADGTVEIKDAAIGLIAGSRQPKVIQKVDAGKRASKAAIATQPIRNVFKPAKDDQVLLGLDAETSSKAGRKPASAFKTKAR